MTEEEQIIHVCRCIIEIRKATEKIQAQYGFNWTSFKKVQDDISGAIPDNGIEIDGYKIYPTHKNIYAVSGGKSIGKVTKLRTTKL